jgi:hypothetical protein
VQNETAMAQQVAAIEDPMGEAAKRVFREFLNNFTKDSETLEEDDVDASQGDHREPLRYYHLMAQEMRRDEKRTLYVDYTHVVDFDDQNNMEEGRLSDAIVLEYYRLQPFLVEAVSQFVREGDEMVDHDEGAAMRLPYFIAFYNLPSLNTIRDLKTLVI